MQYTTKFSIVGLVMVVIGHHLATVDADMVMKSGGGKKDKGGEL